MRLSREDKALAQKWISEYIVMEASGDANMTTEFILTYVDDSAWEPNQQGAAVLYKEVRDVNEFLTREHLNTIVAALRDGKYSRDTVRTYEELEHDSSGRHRSVSRSREREVDGGRGTQQYNANDRAGGRRRDDNRRQDRSRSRERDGRQRDYPSGGYGSSSTAGGGGGGGGRAGTGPAYEPSSYNGARPSYGGGYAAPPPTGMAYGSHHIQPPLLPQPLPTGFGSFAQSHQAGAPLMPPLQPHAHLMQPPAAAAAGGWGSSASVVPAPYGGSPHGGYGGGPGSSHGGHGHGGQGHGAGQGQRQGGRQGQQDRRRQPDQAGDSSSKRSLKVHPVGGPASGLGQLAAWFSKFGTVTNLVNAADGEGHGAKHMYIQMKSHEEALAVVEAWRAGLAVCDDPSIQLEWAQREPGTGWTGKGQGAGQDRADGPANRVPARPEARQNAGSDSWRASVFGKRGAPRGDEYGQGGPGASPEGQQLGPGQLGQPPGRRVDAIEAGLEKANTLLDEKMAELAALNAPLQEQQKRFADLSKQKESLSKEEYAATAKDIKEKLKAIVEQQTNLKNAINTAKKAVEIQKANVDKWAASAGPRPAAGSSTAGTGGADGMSTGQHVTASAAQARQAAADGHAGLASMQETDDAAAGHRRDDEDVEIQLDDDI